MIVEAILIGVLLGILEFAILAASRQELGFWVYAQSVLFWFMCGFMIGIVDSPFPPYVTGGMLAVFLNLSWYINISIIPKQYGHLTPLVIASVVFGLIGGGAKMLLSTLI